VCIDLRRWDDARADGSAGVPERVFVNLSPRQVTDPRLLDLVRRALDENGVPAERLGFEVVEGSIVEPAALALLDSLREAGHAVAVDDFGTGFSSLSRLVRLPITHVKVDKSFIHDLPHDERSRALVEAVLIIADRLHLGVIAEGIENQAQLEYLAGAGCSYLQGYHLARPMPADQLQDLRTPALSH
jgi:EAL domain-containing protein (putative c-di-GMP-specific phosphodiesterase class I)